MRWVCWHAIGWLDIYVNEQLNWCSGQWVYNENRYNYLCLWTAWGLSGLSVCSFFGVCETLTGWPVRRNVQLLSIWCWCSPCPRLTEDGWVFPSLSRQLNTRCNNGGIFYRNGSTLYIRNLTIQWAEDSSLDNIWYFWKLFHKSMLNSLHYHIIMPPLESVNPNLHGSFQAVVVEHCKRISWLHALFILKSFGDNGRKNRLFKPKHFMSGALDVTALALRSQSFLAHRCEL